MSAFAMYMGVGSDVKQKADRIYYLYLDGEDAKRYWGYPFPMIPSNFLALYDLKKEVLGK